MKQMKYDSRLCPVLLLSVLISCAGEDLGLKTWNAYRNPVVLGEVRNPDVIKADDTWYLYADGGSEDGAIQVMSSTDLVNWGALDPLFDADTKPRFIPDAAVGCPSVLHTAGNYLLYYSLHKSDEECGLGVASATTPTGPWTDHGALLVASDISITKLSDPFAFEDDGALWLAFSASDGIYLQRLSDKGLGTTGDPVRIAEGPVTDPVLFKNGGTWFLLSTTGVEDGGASSTAAITLSSASSLTGPYGEGKTLIGRSAKFAGAGSPGHLVRDNGGNDWLLYNAYDLSSLSSGRTLMLDRIQWDGNNTPWVRGNASSFYTDAPVTQ